MSSANNKYIILDNLFNLFLDTKYQQEDEELFKEWEIDIDNVVKKNMLLFRQLKTQAKAELNNVKHNRVKEFLLKMREGLHSNVEEYIKIADEILSKPKFAELKPMFRNLQDISDKDKQAILMDAKLLELLSEIEKDYTNKNNEE